MACKKFACVFLAMLALAPGVRAQVTQQEAESTSAYVLSIWTSTSQAKQGAAEGCVYFRNAYDGFRAHFDANKHTVSQENQDALDLLLDDADECIGLANSFRIQGDLQGFANANNWFAAGEAYRVADTPDYDAAINCYEAALGWYAAAMNCYSETEYHLGVANQELMDYENWWLE